MKRRVFLATGLGVVTTACYPSPIDPSPDRGEGISQDAGSAASLRFVAVGDVGTGKKRQYRVATAMTAYWQTAQYPLTLMLGDNIYNNGKIKKISQVFEQPYQPLLENNVEFRAVLGNHDIRTNDGDDQVAYPGYNMPARYYTFTQGPVQFFALDTTQSYTKDRDNRWESQLDWLDTKLSQSTVPWKVVFGHHTVYSSGSHGLNPTLVRELSPLFSKYGVQLYLNGHDHNYERTTVIEGTTYITSGNGAKLRRVGQSEWTAYASAQAGFTAFNVYPEWIDVRAIGTDGNIFDTAEISRVL